MSKVTSLRAAAITEPSADNQTARPKKTISRSRVPSRQDRKEIEESVADNLLVGREEFEKNADQLGLEDAEVRDAYLPEIAQWEKDAGGQICEYFDPRNPNPPTIAPAEVAIKRNLMVLKFMTAAIEMYPANVFGLRQLAHLGTECLKWLRPGDVSYVNQPFLQEVFEVSPTNKHLTVKLPVLGGKAKRFISHCPGGDLVIQTLKAKADVFWNAEFEKIKAERDAEEARQKAEREKFRAGFQPFAKKATATLFDALKAEAGKVALYVPGEKVGVAYRQPFGLLVEVRKTEKGAIVAPLEAFNIDYTEIVRSGTWLPAKWLRFEAPAISALPPAKQRLAARFHRDLRRAFINLTERRN